MQLRTILVGGLALVFSGSAALGVYLFARQPKGEGDIETVSIVVAAAPVSRGVTLSADMLQTRDWPKASVPEEALLLVEEAVGRTVWIPLVANDLVFESKLATKDAGRGMAALIPRGMRAVTIQTPNVATGVAGFILPGNKVDVLWTYSQIGKNDDTGGGSTITLLQNVEILAVDQQIDIPNENKTKPGEMRSVTLLVSPSDASKLDLGQNRGTLRLSLRNPEDKAIDDIEMATLLGMRHASALPLVSATSLETSQSGALASAKPGIPEILPTLARPPDILLPIRTLRGTSSGVVNLRQQPGRTAHGEDRLLITDNSKMVTVPVHQAAGDVRVRGYFRSNGTYVQPHYRSQADGKFHNNWSTHPNVNPFTGQMGTRETPPK